MTFLKFAAVALMAFGGLAVVMYLAQRKLMYFPENLRTQPAAAGFPAAEEITLATADGERVIAWHVPPRANGAVVLYFHGNGGSLRLRNERFQKITADGTGLVALSYRGYGGSSGSPTEAGLLADADAVYAFAIARYPAERIVLWGESLGSGVAIALAAKRKVGRAILESPFTSAADIGASVYWYVPVRLLMKDQFRSDERIRRVTVPILILHGTDDDVVPIAFGERLYAIANEPKRLVRIPGGGHVNLDGFGAQDVTRPFIAEAAR
jgi:fermentation-respiration switch protein FrsA (DUF1100 family)